MKRVVLITSSEPEPRNYGKPVVLGGILDHLCERLGPDNVHVALVGRTDTTRAAVPYRLHVIPKPRATDQARALATRVMLPPHRSLQEAALYSPRVRDALGRLLTDLRAELEIWDTIRLGQYAPDMPPGRRILYADDLFSLRYESMLRDANQGGNGRSPLGNFGRMLPRPAARLLASPRIYRPLLHLERRLVARSERSQPHLFEQTLLVNDAEAEALRRHCPATGIGTLRPFLKEKAQVPRPDPLTPTFAFIGGFDYAPNVEGLDWFLRSCREQVARALPEFELHVIGKGSEQGLSSAAAWGERVKFHGWVDDLAGLLARCAALVSPLLTGSGTKIKVLEALSRGMPVVATPDGVRGIEQPQRAGCLVAADPQGLTRALAAACSQPTQDRLATDARAAWERRYGTAVMRRHYDEVFSL